MSALSLPPSWLFAQLNGGWGVDFSAVDPALGPGLQLVARRLLAHGVTAFLPTVITSSKQAYLTTLPQLVPTAGSANGAAVLGVHLEGPFLSPSKPGCHPPSNIVPPDGRPEALRRACGEHISHVRLVTLAPELEGAKMLVDELLARGVVVSAGHSNATAAQMEASLTWGVRMATHLFNAMPPFHPREPGIVGLLGSDSHPRPYLGLISDGVHVHPASVKIAAMARPESVVLVSDGINALGLPEGSHTFGENIVKIQGDRAYVGGTTTLAGAVVALDECMRRYKRFTQCSVVQALEAASLHAAEALGLASSKGQLHLGADADLILLDDDLNVQATYVRGVRAWSADAGFAAALEDESSLAAATPPKGAGMSAVAEHIGSGRVVPAGGPGSKRKKR